MRQKILKLSKARFNVLWDNLPEQLIMLDFNPLINHFNLQKYKNYILLHWQSRPRGLRRWGCYCGHSDQYYGCDYDKIVFDKNNTIELLQLDELKLINPPSAVVLLPNQKLIYQSGMIQCGNL